MKKNLIIFGLTSLCIGEAVLIVKNQISFHKKEKEITDSVMIKINSIINDINNFKWGR